LVCLISSDFDGWSEEANQFRKGSVVQALAMSAQRFREKEGKNKQRFPILGSRSSRRSSKLGLGMSFIIAIIFLASLLPALTHRVVIGC